MVGTKGRGGGTGFDPEDRYLSHCELEGEGQGRGYRF